MSSHDLTRNVSVQHKILTKLADFFHGITVFHVRPHFMEKNEQSWKHNLRAPFLSPTVPTGARLRVLPGAASGECHGVLYISYISSYNNIRRHTTYAHIPFIQQKTIPKSKGGSKVWNNHTTQRTQRTLIQTLIKVTNFNVWLTRDVPTDQNRAQAWMGHRNSVSFFLPLRWTRRKYPPSIRSFESTTWDVVDWMKRQLS